jgi:phosphoribosylformylglycinamidine cyclo-ligase
MWRTFNCGVGFVLVLAPGEVAAVSASLTSLGLAHREIGSVVARDSGERVRFVG